MKNWKTTTFGLISGVAAFVALTSPAGIPAWGILTAKFIAGGGLAALGIAGKDSNVTGGKVQQ